MKKEKQVDYSSEYEEEEREGEKNIELGEHHWVCIARCGLNFVVCAGIRSSLVYSYWRFNFFPIFIANEGFPPRLSLLFSSPCSIKFLKLQEQEKNPKFGRPKESPPASRWDFQVDVHWLYTMKLPDNTLYHLHAIPKGESNCFLPNAMRVTPGKGHEFINKMFWTQVSNKKHN